MQKRIKLEYVGEIRKLLYHSKLGSNRMRAERKTNTLRKMKKVKNLTELMIKYDFKELDAMYIGSFKQSMLKRLLSGNYYPRERTMQCILQ